MQRVLLILALLGSSTAAGAGGSGLPPAGSPTSESPEAVAHPEAGEEEEGHDEKSDDSDGGHHSSRISDRTIPLQVDAVPKRPKPIIDTGNKYLVSGTLKPGFKVPGGAVWQPSLLAFGTWRTAVQTLTLPDGSQRSEWANRLDIGFNLQLTGSERLVIGVRALGADGFTGYTLQPDPLPGQDRWEEDLNGDIQTLFFEGDFGELFPNLDRSDTGSADIGFAIGRQRLFFQEGMLINDTIDGIGLTRNTLQPSGTSNFRATLFYGADNLHRNNNVEDDSRLVALLTSTDFRRTTLDVDVAWVTDGAIGGQASDQAAIGISAVQRIGKLNTAFRLLGSAALEQEIDGLTTDGALFFTELSWTPHYSHDLVYITAFGTMDEFTSAARDPTTGTGPLARAGISFAAPGIGRFGSALPNRANDVAGGAFGYQKFLRDDRQQLIFEIATRVSTVSTGSDAAAASIRYQAAFGRRSLVVVDGSVGYYDEPSILPAGAVFETTRYGARLEYQLRF